MPPLASDSEDDNLYEEIDNASDATTTDEEEDDGEQMEPEEPRQKTKRTNESDLGQATKRAREPQEPPTPEEVHPPRQRVKDEQSRDKNARKCDFAGKEEKEGKDRKRGKGNGNLFCFPEKPNPLPNKTEGFSFACHAGSDGQAHDKRHGNALKETVDNTAMRPNAAAPR